MTVFCQRICHRCKSCIVAMWHYNAPCTDAVCSLWSLRKYSFISATTPCSFNCYILGLDRLIMAAAVIIWQLTDCSIGCCDNYMFRLTARQSHLWAEEWRRYAVVEFLSIQLTSCDVHGEPEKKLTICLPRCTVDLHIREKLNIDKI